MSTDVRWSEERTTKLVEMWPTGIPVRKILLVLNEMPGPELTKNALGCKRDRLGLPGRSLEAVKIAAKLAAPRSPQAPSVPRNRRAGAGLNMKGAKAGGPPAVFFAGPEVVMSPEPKAPYAAKARVFDPLPGSIPVPFMSPGCKWPVGGEGDALVCCGARPATKRPYCADHVSVAYMPIPPGRPKTGSELARSLRRYI